MNEFVFHGTAGPLGPAHRGKVSVPTLLFVAGEYPDKSVTITTDHLHQIAADFTACPVKAEHLDSPLDPLGEVVAVYVQGNELHGVLSFSEGIAAHIAERGARNVSIRLKIDEAGKFTIPETSLVFSPRVAGAGFLTPTAIENKLAAFSNAGKLTPAMRPAVSRLLAVGSGDGSVTFSDGTAADIPTLLDALFNALPIITPRTPAAAVLTAQTDAPAAIKPDAKTMEVAGMFGVSQESVAKILNQKASVR